MLMIRAGSARDEIAGEDLHVAGQHDEVDAARPSRAARALLLALVLARDGKDVELDPELLGDGLQIRVVAHDERNLAGELAGAVAQQQVVQAVVGTSRRRSPFASEARLTHRAAASRMFEALCDLGDGPWSQGRPVRVRSSDSVHSGCAGRKIPAWGSVCWSASRMLAPCP